MNKVFKIVFNAARGSLMVVNEATSSIQTGKKAAVTVAMVGALAASAANAVEVTLDTYDSSKRYGNQMTTLVSGDSIKVTLDNLQGIPAQSSAIRPGMQNGWTQSAELVVNGGNFVADASLNKNNWSLYGGDFLAKGSGEYTIGDATNPMITTSVTLNGVTGNLDVYGSGSIKATNSNYFAKSSKVVVTDSVLNGLDVDGGNHGRIYGAGLLFARGSTMTYDESSVEVTNVVGSRGSDEVATYVYGGGFVRGAENGADASAGQGTVLYTKQSSVTVNGDDTKLSRVVGGSHISGNATTNAAMVKADNTKVTVNAGFVEAVIGGHHVNYFGCSEISNQSEVVINGGKVDLVVGGNYLDFEAVGYDGTGEAARTAKVQKSVVTINGGTIGTVVGGGYAYIGAGTNLSFVDNVTDSSSIQIENATITGDVIGGGLSDGDGTSVDVKVASIELSNATIEGEGLITTNSVAQNGGSAKNVTDATVKLTNVAAENARLESDVGTVELRAEGVGKTTLGDLDVADDVKVALTADGAANDAVGGDITQAIVVANDDFTASVAMEEGMHQGAVTGTIEGGVVKATQVANSIMSNTLDLASAAPLSMNRLLMNDVRKRMGDLRAAEGTHGVWARYDGGKLKGDAGLENDFNTIQVGIDTVPVADAPRFGVAFAYTKSDADMKRGSADMDAFSLAFYGTKFYDNGMFVDVIGRMATADTDVTVDGNKKGTMDNIALSLSGEFGWRFDVTDQFYVEPQAELTYTYVNADKLDLSGSVYEFDSVDSLLGRVGFAAGFKCPSNFGDVYVRASAVHEFLGDSAVRGGSAIHEVDGEDTWVEFGLGANFNVNKNTYVYVDIERTEGAKLEEDWRANVGVRFAF